MVKYRCSVCGYIFDEDAEGKKFSELKECPVCHQPADRFYLYEEEKPAAVQEKKELKLDYPKEFVRQDDSCRYMKEIHEMAVTGKSISAAMGTEIPMPDWDDILILGAQLDPMPLDEDAPVDTRTVIGKHAAKPLVLDNPVYISHMSFGALSREAKISLAKGSAMAHTAMCSGEGGIRISIEEMEAAEKYIFEYVGNLYSVTPENLRKCRCHRDQDRSGDKAGDGWSFAGRKGDGGDQPDPQQTDGQRCDRTVQIPGDRDKGGPEESDRTASVCVGRKTCGSEDRSGKDREGSCLLRLRGAGFHHHRRQRRSYRIVPEASERFRQCAYHLCIVPGEKISGQRRIGHQS